MRFLLRQLAILAVRLFTIFLTVFFLAGCETLPPLDDYSLARSAMESATLVESGKYSPGFMHKAEAAYQRAEAFFHDNEFEQARGEFRSARLWAEKAENSARLIRFKNGEVL